MIFSLRSIVNVDMLWRVFATIQNVNYTRIWETSQEALVSNETASKLAGHF